MSKAYFFIASVASEINPLGVCQFLCTTLGCLLPQLFPAHTYLVSFLITLFLNLPFIQGVLHFFKVSPINNTIPINFTSLNSILITRITYINLFCQPQYQIPQVSIILHSKPFLGIAFGLLLTLRQVYLKNWYGVNNSCIKRG